MATGWPMKTTYANGDVYSASDVNDTNGTINLLTSSTLSVAAAKNGWINGGMDFWQRSTSISVATTTATYTADRWAVATGATTASTISRQVTGDTTNLPSIQYCARVQRNLAQTGTSFVQFSQSMESVNAIPFAGKTVTLSFYARRGANYSAASNVLNVLMLTGTGTDQQVLVSYTGSVSAINSTATLTTTWQRFSYTVTLGATATEIGLDLYYTPVGVAGAADYFEVTGVQLELGSTATTFSRAGGTIQGELAACQRYFQYLSGSASGRLATGYARTSTRFDLYTPLLVTMRTAPSLTATGQLVIETGASGSLTTTAVTLNEASPWSVTTYNTVSGATNGYGGIAYFSTNASFSISAEL